MRYPIKLDDKYPCRGIDADGKMVVYEDFLEVGQKVGPAAPEDEDGGEALYIDAQVVLREGGLWVDALDAKQGPTTQGESA